VTAGVGKLADLPGSRKALVGFGVPERPASILGTLLPVAELATALALLLRPSAQWGAGAALVLLAVFVAGIANAMRHGEAPDCHCFGAIHSAPVGKGQIARNGVLAAVAIFVLGWGSGPALDTWVSARSAAELVAVITGVAAILLLAVAVEQWLEIRRLRTELLEAQATGGAVAGLAVGAPAPSFELTALGGDTVSLDALRARGRPIMLVFMSAGCGPCEAMLPELGRLQVTLADRLTIGLVGGKTIERYGAAREARDGLSLNDAREEDPVLDEALKELVELFNAYRLAATPSGVLVTPQGTIGSATVNGHLAIEALIRLTLSRVPGPAALAPTAA
jgi:thiol-disulfide isomerase/thioredoxin